MIKIILNSLLFILVNFALVGQSFVSQEAVFDVLESYGNDTNAGGTGISFADFNNDGLDDLSFSSEDGKDILFYENTGTDFKLLAPFVSNTFEGRQILWIDFDNDGDKDIFYATNDHGVYLYQNDGNFNFTDVSLNYGLPVNNDFVSGATFGDINNDGYLDLYLSKYNLQNQLFTFDGSTYSDITSISNTGNGNGPTFCSSFFDFNNDNLLDLYVINDKISHANVLYMNMGGNNFVDVSVPSNTNLSIDAMNAGIGDYNNDGYFDIYVTDNHTASLLENQGNNTFIDVASATNTTFDRVGWGGNFLDMDNDMDQDLYVSSTTPGFTNPSALYKNDNNIYSEPFFSNGGISASDTLGSISNMIGDLNNDGLQDIVTGGYEFEPFRIFLNHDQSNNNFIKLNLNGVNSNKDAYGAVVEIKSGGTTQWFTHLSANAYISQNSDYINIGLGQETSIDTLIVYWPFSNSVDGYSGSDLTINKLNTIEEGNPVVTINGLDLCLNEHTIKADPIPSHTYVGNSSLLSNTTIEAGADVVFHSSNNITLNPGFEIKTGAIFTVEIDNCQN